MVYSAFVAGSDKEVIALEKVLPWLSFQPSSRLLSGFPEDSDVYQSKEIILVCSDGFTSTTQAKFHLTVTYKSLQLLRSVPDQRVHVGDYYDYVLPLSQFTEINAVTLFVDYLVQVEEQSEDIAVVFPWINKQRDLRRISGKPTSETIGNYTILITYRDRFTAGSSFFKFEIYNSCPTVVRAFSTIYLDFDQMLSYYIIAEHHFLDGDGDPLAIHISWLKEQGQNAELPYWVTFDPRLHILQGQITTHNYQAIPFLAEQQLYYERYVFNVSAQDSSGESAS